MRNIAIGIVVLSLFVSNATAQERIYSGPQPGESLSPFRVLEISAPHKIKEIEVAKPKENETTLLMFVHKVTEPALGLMITVEWYAHQQKDLSSHYVFLAEDRAQMESQVKRWSSRSFLADSPMCISLDGPEGPGRYGLNRKHAEMTVLIANHNEVVSNFALRAANNTDAPKILNALAQAQKKPSPSIDKIKQELRAARTARREQRMREMPVFRLAPHEDLGQLMVQMLFREGASEAHAHEVRDVMATWARDDDEKKAALTKYCKDVLAGRFQVNRYARDALQKLASE